MVARSAGTSSVNEVASAVSRTTRATRSEWKPWSTANPEASAVRSESAMLTNDNVVLLD